MPQRALAEAFDGDTPLFQSKLETLHAAWDAKCAPGQLPKWSDFSARDLKSWLPNIAVIDRIGDPPRFKVRLMGTGCVRIGGKDYTGCWVDETAHHISRKGIEDAYRQCLTSKKAIFRRVEYVKERMVRATVYRLFMPCLDADGLPNIVLAGVYKIEEFGQYFELPEQLIEKVIVEPTQTVVLL